MSGAWITDVTFQVLIKNLSVWGYVFIGTLCLVFMQGIYPVSLSTYSRYTLYYVRLSSRVTRDCMVNSSYKLLCISKSKTHSIWKPILINLLHSERLEFVSKAVHVLRLCWLSKHLPWSVAKRRSYSFPFNCRVDSVIVCSHMMQ